MQGPGSQNPTLGLVVGIRKDRGAAIPYLGFVEVNLQIPGIRGYNEDVLLLAIPTTTYSEGVPVVVGSEIIDRALSCMTVGGTCTCDCNMATGSFWGSHVGVGATIP